MTIVVADTGPIHYLILIGQIDLLPLLYDRVILPRAVLAELTHPNAPVAVRDWASSLPVWSEVKTAMPITLVAILDPGEAEAIALAKELHADALLLDEREGRAEAIRLGLKVTGTIGMLEKAALLKFVDFAASVEKLKRTNFRIDPNLVSEAQIRVNTAKRNSD